MRCIDSNYDLETCRGAVEYYPALPTRYTRAGNMVCFARCEKHYEEYEERYEARLERERAYEASLYCPHGTYVGDAWGPDYLCGACESAY